MKEVDISELVYDDHNFNKGSEDGKNLLRRSFDEFGAGRSVLVDKNNMIIAGNKSVEVAADAGIKKVIIVESEGDELIAVKRTDLVLDSREGRMLALADNAVSVVNLSFDEDELKNSGIDYDEWGVVLMPDISKEDVDAFLDNNSSECEDNDIVVSIVFPSTDIDLEKIMSLLYNILSPYNVKIKI